MTLEEEAPVAGGRRLYLSGLTDSSRWDAVAIRPGDIVISAPSKCGTTWMQMVCALLVFQQVDLPAPLTTLSPWVDMRLRPLPDLVARLESQAHRRFLKTHTPLDGLPRRDDVTYLVAGRDPRDVGVSMAHHRANLNGAVIEGARRTMASHPDLASRLKGWIDDDRPPGVNLSSLSGTLWHLGQAWAQRGSHNVVLVHYDDLLSDLEGQMRMLASVLHIEVQERAWPELVGAATLEQMRQRATDLAPDERMDLILDPARFFRSGRSGGWRSAFGDAELRRYDERARDLAPPDLLAWLHR